MHYDKKPSYVAAFAFDAHPLQNLRCELLALFPLKSMLSRSPLPALIVLLACTLLTALLPFLAASLSASHDPMVNVQVQLVRHGEIPGADQEASGHQHEDGSVEEGRWGHQHGHSAIDHSHEPLFVPPEHALIFCMDTPQWSLHDSIIGPSAHVAALERPPKPTTA